MNQILTKIAKALEGDVFENADKEPFEFKSKFKPKVTTLKAEGEKMTFRDFVDLHPKTAAGAAAGVLATGVAAHILAKKKAQKNADIQKHAALNELMDSGIDFDSAVELVKQASGDWMEHAVKHPGALHEELGIPEGKKIPASTLARAAKAGGKLGMRARLAEQFKKADAKKK